jgi:hypothetical protein
VNPLERQQWHECLDWLRERNRTERLTRRAHVPTIEQLDAWLCVEILGCPQASGEIPEGSAPP